MSALICSMSRDFFVFEQHRGIFVRRGVNFICFEIIALGLVTQFQLWVGFNARFAGCAGFTSFAGSFLSCGVFCGGFLGRWIEVVRRF